MAPSDCSKITLIIYILISTWISSVKLSLLWPQFTVLQITASFSVPVEVPKRKVYFDWGFQMNYDLPYNLSSFYNIPIWPTNQQSKRRSLDDDHYRKYASDLDTSTIHPNDLTAGEFYSAIEDLLESYGYHETCLLKSVCEIARHPFDLSRKSLLAEVITFALSPSLHKAFSKNEVQYRKVYEEAEFFGRTTENDCRFLYPLCKKDILQLISNVVYEN